MRYLFIRSGETMNKELRYIIEEEVEDSDYNFDNVIETSSILSSLADKKRQKPWIYKASGVFIYIRKVDLAVRLIV